MPSSERRIRFLGSRLRQCGRSGSLLASFLMCGACDHPRPSLAWTGKRHLPATSKDRAVLAGRPSPLHAGDWRIGEQIEDLPFVDAKGATGRLSDFAGAPVVIALRDAGCPVSERQGLRLAEIEREFAVRGVAFLFVNTRPEGGAAEAALDVERYGFTGRYLLDPTGAIGSALMVRSTADVFVLDRARTLVFRGAIDDQSARGSAEPEVKSHYLRDALTAVLAGATPAVEATTAPGSALEFPPPPPADPATATFHGRIARIVQRHCQTCHRPNGIAPFELTDANDLRGHRKMIKSVIESGLMPPWFAAPDTGPWINDSRLAEHERADLLAWLASGLPEGDPKDAPVERQWQESWAIGTPDYILEVPAPVVIPATGVMPYFQCAIPSPVPEDCWIERVQILPEVAEVVHHVLLYYREPDGMGGYFDSMLPGKPATVFPEGHAKFLAKGTEFRLQIHYTPNGTACTDRTRIGLKLARRPPDHELFGAIVREPNFRIPAGDPNYRVEAQFIIPEDAYLRRFMPHMHLRGKAFRIDLRFPDGTAMKALDLPQWDPDWQLYYELREPIRAPKGTVVDCTAWYDNSAANPNNPDPTKEVERGEQVFQEMMGVYVEWVFE